MQSGIVALHRRQRQPSVRPLLQENRALQYHADCAASVLRRDEWLSGSNGEIVPSGADQPCLPRRRKTLYCKAKPGGDATDLTPATKELRPCIELRRGGLEPAAPAL